MRVPPAPALYSGRARRRPAGAHKMAAASTQGPRAPKLAQLLERDPYLAPFEQDFQRRYGRGAAAASPPSPCSALPPGLPVGCPSAGAAPLPPTATPPLRAGPPLPGAAETPRAGAGAGWRGRAGCE